MKHFGLFGILTIAIGFVACGDDGSSASVDDVSSSSWIDTNSSSSSSRTQSSDSDRMDSVGSSSLQNDNQSSSSSDMFTSASSAKLSDTTKITYTLKRFDGPLANPHKGFTVPTGGAWVFVPEFEYGPYGSLNNKAWDLVTYGSGHQRWSKLNPAKDVYDWTELDKLLDALADHDMGYALRVLPYSPSYIKGDDTPEEEYD